MICENCKKDHDGLYGTGRFCCKQCASAFATKAKREEINIKVSNKLLGRKSPNEGRKQSAEIISKRMLSFTQEKRNEAIEKTKQLRHERYINTSFNELPSVFLKKRRVKEEQDYKCNQCGISEWLKKPITLEVEHKDGNKNNNTRENLEALCPNCHSFTPTWRKSKKAKKIICESLAPVVKR